MHFPARRLIPFILCGVLSLLAVQPDASGASRMISEDRELKEIDLAGWNCLDKPEGSARTPDGMERNRLKNRSPTDVSAIPPEDVDIAGFLKDMSAFDAQTQNTRRKDLTPEQRQQLEPLENKLVQLTGYLVFAYCGPPETTNCASVDFHDWHLEVFDQASDHPPQPGDPTPIICEITPRTQNAIFHDGIRIQELTGFFRPPDVTYQSTGHPARRVRVIGYRMWDDEHNGKADVGETVKRSAPNKFHNPWRRSAWEIHPVIKIVPLDNAPVQAVPAGPSPTTAATSPTGSSPPTEKPGPSSQKAPLTTPPSPTHPQIVTLTQSVKIRIPYGEATLPAGMKLPVKSYTSQTVTIEYMGGSYSVPVSSTDFK